MTNRRSSSPWLPATDPQPDLPKYHEGFLEKKFKSGYQRIWAEIKADLMYFYNPERQEQPALGYLQLVRTTTVEYPKSKGKDRGQHKFIVKSNKYLHKFKVISAQLRDVWKAYILTIATHVIPEDLNFLPGQLIDVRRTLEQETYRLANQPPPVTEQQTYRLANQPSPVTPQEPYRLANRPPPVTPNDYSLPGVKRTLSAASSGYSSSRTMSGSGDSAGSVASNAPPPAVEMHAYRFYPDYLKERGRVNPPWFFHLLPRDLVDKVLSDNIVHGNMLLRSSESAPGGLVLSARLPVDGEPQVRHYIVHMTNGHFVLDIDKRHPPILNLYELINYFIDQSGGNVVPLETSELSQLALPKGWGEGEEDKVVKLDQCPHWGEWGPKPVPKSIVNMLKYSVPPDELHKVQEMSIHNPPNMRLPAVDYDQEPPPIFLEHDDDDVHDYVSCEEEIETHLEDTTMKIPRPKLS